MHVNETPLASGDVMVWSFDLGNYGGRSKPTPDKYKLTGAEKAALLCVNMRCQSLTATRGRHMQDLILPLECGTIVSFLACSNA